MEVPSLNDLAVEGTLNTNKQTNNQMIYAWSEWLGYQQYHLNKFPYISKCGNNSINVAMHQYLLIKRLCEHCILRGTQVSQRSHTWKHGPLLNSPDIFYIDMVSHLKGAGMAQCSVMDCHTRAWGSIPGGNSLKTELHVLRKGQSIGVLSLNDLAVDGT